MLTWAFGLHVLVIELKYLNLLGEDKLIKMLLLFFEKLFVNLAIIIVVFLRNSFITSLCHCIISNHVSLIKKMPFW